CSARKTSRRSSTTAASKRACPRSGKTRPWLRGWTTSTPTSRAVRTGPSPARASRKPSDPEKGRRWTPGALLQIFEEERPGRLTKRADGCSVARKVTHALVHDRFGHRLARQRRRGGEFAFGRVRQRERGAGLLAPHGRGDAGDGGSAGAGFRLQQH